MVSAGIYSYFCTKKKTGEMQVELGNFIFINPD